MKIETMNSDQNYKKLMISVLLGAAIGIITAVFYWLLQKTALIHSEINTSFYVLLLPAVWVLIYFFRRRTLYFPNSVASVYNADAITMKHSNRNAIGYTFLGSFLGHAAGASIGREGAVVVFGAHISRLVQLDWTYWRPVIMAASFAIATEQPWVALVFMFEMFSSSLAQKVWTLVVAWVGVLVLRSLHIPSLLMAVNPLVENSFFEKLFYIFTLALVIGFSARIYKWLLLYLKMHFKKNMWMGLLAVVLLTMIFFFGAFKNIHSLSLLEFPSLQLGQMQIETVIFKFIFTLLFVAIGFWGGEYVPSVLIGGGLGVWLAQKMQIDPLWALSLSAFSFFAGLTKLKWTGLALTISVFGWSYFSWGYFLMILIQGFCGSLSLYKNEILHLPKY